MSLPQPILAAIPAAAAAIAVVILVLIWQFREPTDWPGSAPAMTLEGVIALVSREHLGCPDQPALVLTADAVYEGGHKWRVTYEDHEWIVDETDGSINTVGDPLPCPRAQ